MTRIPSFGRKALLFAAVLALVVGVFWPGEEALTDDRDLLRFATGKPYLFILLDSSGSMNLQLGAGNNPTVGYGDDPDSRIYAAKEALFSVFEDIDDIHFGFATFNQDGLRVDQSHWLYYVDDIPSNWPTGSSTAGKLLAGWPTVDADGLAYVDADGVLRNDVEGDAVVFGRTFNRDPDLDGPPRNTQGSCGAPLDLTDATDRARFNAYAKLGTSGRRNVILWIGSAGGGSSTKHYAVRFREHDSELDEPGDSKLVVRVAVLEADSCSDSSPDVLVESQFSFLRDNDLAEFLMVDRGTAGNTSGNNASEWTSNLWVQKDAQTDNDCGAANPFSGKGWDGNYDSGVTVGTTTYDDLDRYGNCEGLLSNPDTCSKLRPLDDTEISSYGRALDSGDMLPFHWVTDNKTKFLQRLAPNWPDATNPDFGVTRHLREGTGFGTTYYQPARNGREPIIAVGDTPLGKAINDVRCWYMGDKGSGNGGKCRGSAYFEEGWSDRACSFDSEYGCRRPFLIMITDGDDTCPGENPGADVSDMKSFTGVQTWALNLGDPKNCNSGSLKSITTRANGECVNVANRDDLKRTLRDILGQIREQSRAFASAAVPSVQTTADQALYISNFTPLNNKPVWDGHLNAFLKPLPFDDDLKPDVTKVCDPNDDEASGCFLWDAGQVLLTQVDASDPVGTAPDKRRVYYAADEPYQEVPKVRRFFETDESQCDNCVKVDADGNEIADESAFCNVCRDLFDGFGFSYDRDSSSQVDAAAEKAEDVVEAVLDVKTHTPRNPDGTVAGPDIEYLLGDVFHANPLVVGTPVNVPYFARNVGDDGTDCTAGDDTNTGYRCFLQRHQFRRKVILVGSNDGQMHAFNAGRAGDVTRNGATETRYDNGSGNELWSFIPRAVMPTLVKIADPNSRHEFTVDGTPSVADVFVDPKHAGVPDATEREWRTVAIGGLREGGRGYFALDITQPDPLTKREDGTFLPTTTSAAVPGCLTEGNLANSAEACGPLPYPALLWEFADTTDDSLLVGNRPSRGQALDEDPNPTDPGYGSADLGETWSVPTVGRIRICEGSACDPDDPDNDGGIRDAYVAVFGGGMDPSNKLAPTRGGFLYMVDIETGKVIYKRRFEAPAGATHAAGAAAMDAAAVDTDQDSYLDRIYIGTTGGYLYRVDLGLDSSGNIPALANTNVRALDGFTYAVQRIIDDAWAPRLLFNANIDAATGTETARPRSLYHRPSVIFASNLGLYGLALGTGDREDLWTTDGDPGRFYVFVDDTDLQETPAVYDERNFRSIGVFDNNIAEDLFVSRNVGQKGWYLELDPNERVITNSFSLSGITVFSSYLPDVAITADSECDPLGVTPCPPVTGTCGEKSFESETRGVCAKTGASRLFVVGTTNANRFLQGDTVDSLSRFSAVDQFVTNPFTEPGQNPNDEGGGTEPTSDDLTQTEINVMNALMSLFPRNCRFANTRIDIKTIAADTRVQRIASVPVCIVQKNWKEY